MTSIQLGTSTIGNFLVEILFFFHQHFPHLMFDLNAWKNRIRFNFKKEYDTLLS